MQIKLIVVVVAEMLPLSFSNEDEIADCVSPHQVCLTFRAFFSEKACLKKRGDGKGSISI